MEFMLAVLANLQATKTDDESARHDETTARPGPGDNPGRLCRRFGDSEAGLRQAACASPLRLHRLTKPDTAGRLLGMLPVPGRALALFTTFYNSFATWPLLPHISQPKSMKTEANP